MSTIFSSSRQSGYRLLAAVLLSAAILLVEQRTQLLDPVRVLLGYVTSPIHLVADVPASVGDWLGERLQGHADLVAENQRLERQNLILQQKAQQLAVMEAENARLRELLNSSSRVDASVSVAEIIGVSPNPSRQEIIINRGRNAQVHLGQVVLDAHGIMGQVSQVGAFTSHVLLITDANHAMSVRVSSNGLRGILAGSGRGDVMHLLYVPASANVNKGDLLVSTGLEGRFPRGYPVAKVTQVTRTDSSPFLQIEARPKAHIHRASHVLLLTLKVSSALNDVARERNDG